MTAFTHDAYFTKTLADADPDVFKGIQGELGRQREQIELIASENIVSQAVLDAQPLGPTPIAGKPRNLVKKWKLDDLTPALTEGLKGRDFDRGRRLFGEANCFTCHRFGNEGGMTGPDLTQAGGRYSASDLLDNIIKVYKGEL